MKNSITGDDFNLVTMMFVDNEYFTTLGERSDNQWEEMPQQYQITVDDWSGGLRVSGVHLKLDKIFWYTI